MFFLKLLCSIVGIFLCFTSIMYIIGRKFYHFSADKAEEEVKNLLITGFGLLKKSELEPLASDILVCKCFNILQQNFSLLDGTANYEPCCDYGFYALKFDITTAYLEEKFVLATVQLKKCTLNYFKASYDSPLAYVFFEEHGINEFYFYICYACSKECKTNLLNFVHGRQNVARQDVIEREKPVFDDALEKELRELNR